MGAHESLFCRPLSVRYRCESRVNAPIVHVVTKAWCVNNSQLHFKLLLFQLCFDNLDLRKFVQLLMMALGVIFGRGEFGGEKSVNESRLAQSAFTCDKNA